MEYLSAIRGFAPNFSKPYSIAAGNAYGVASNSPGGDNKEEKELKRYDKCRTDALYDVSPIAD